MDHPARHQTTCCSLSHFVGRELNRPDPVVRHVSRLHFRAGATPIRFFGARPITPLLLSTTSPSWHSVGDPIADHLRRQEHSSVLEGDNSRSATGPAIGLPRSKALRLGQGACTAAKQMRDDSAGHSRSSRRAFQPSAGLDDAELALRMDEPVILKKKDIRGPSTEIPDVDAPRKADASRCRQIDQRRDARHRLAEKARRHRRQKTSARPGLSL